MINRFVCVTMVSNRNNTLYFRKLFKYIKGANNGSVVIPMTAPGNYYSSAFKCHLRQCDYQYQGTRGNGTGTLSNTLKVAMYQTPSLCRTVGNIRVNVLLFVWSSI